MVEEIFDQPCHASLAEPEVPDMVNVFRRSEDLPEVAEEAVAVERDHGHNWVYGVSKQQRLPSMRAWTS